MPASSSNSIVASQKGDVYSFAIILHEIVMRQGPFYLGENLMMDPRGKYFLECHTIRDVYSPFLPIAYNLDWFLRMIDYSWYYKTYDIDILVLAYNWYIIQGCVEMKTSLRVMGFKKVTLIRNAKVTLSNQSKVEANRKICIIVFYFLFLII